MPYYAVAKGRSTGVYQSWGDCEGQVKGYSGASFKRFDTPQEARAFVNSGGSVRSSSGFSRDNSGYVEVYTDGACSGNGQDGARAGLGVYWGENHKLNTSAPVSGRATNNAGEIQAATRAMKQAVDSGVQKLAINTDSDFLIKSATEWMPTWKQNGWKTASGEPVKNQQDFKELDRMQRQLDVKWNHVDAHKGIHGNEMADRLAKEGANKYN